MTSVAIETVVRFIKKRNGDVVDFDLGRIKNVLVKAYASCQVLDTSDLDEIVESILVDLDGLQKTQDAVLTVEQAQDTVEKNLMKFQKFEIAKSYILYRQEHKEAREQEHAQQVKKFERNALQVIKKDGTSQSFDLAKIKKIFDRVVVGFEEECDFATLEEQMKKYVIEGIHTSDIIKLLIKSAIDLISVEKTGRQYVAGRLAADDLYKQAQKNRAVDLAHVYTGKTYLELMTKYVEKGLYYKDFFEHYTPAQIMQAGDAMVQTRDYDYNYTTMLMYKKRYLLNPNKVINELPQEMYMSIALFLAIPEPEATRLDTAIALYHACSKGELSLPTPTLLNARTNFHQLSSCFKMNFPDDLRGIYHQIENMAQISKFGGGIGSYLGHVRSRGASIRGYKGAAGGVAPWIKVINDTAIAVNQLGARAGAISTTLDVRHKDIYEFLDMQTETGDMRRKAFDIFPAVAFPDLFFKRLEANEPRSLFDPKEVRDFYGKSLENHFGEEFEAFYAVLEADTRLELKEVVSAKDLFKKYLKSVVETGMPYAFLRDTANKYNPNKHAGNVYSTQLCTEIIQNVRAPEFLGETLDADGNVTLKYDTGEMVVCNLSSINVAKVNTTEDIERVIPLAMRALDNVITLNYFPIKEAEKTAEKYRSVGLGFLGLAEYLAVNHLKYDSAEARAVVNKLFEKYAFATLKASNELAVERAPYPLFPGSERSKGILMGKDKARFNANTESTPRH